MDSIDRDLREQSSERVVPFMELYTRYHRQLYVYIASLIVNPADAQDLLQETSLILWQKFNEFEPNTSFLAWARTIARYRVLQHHEKTHRAVGVLSPDVLEMISSDAHVSEQEEEAQHAALLECLCKLRPADRDLIHWRYQTKTSVKDLASKQGRSANAVSRALARVRATLFDCIRRRLSNAGEGAGNV